MTLLVGGIFGEWSSANFEPCRLHSVSIVNIIVSGFLSASLIACLTEMSIRESKYAKLVESDLIPSDSIDIDSSSSDFDDPEVNK